VGTGQDKTPETIMTASFCSEGGWNHEGFWAGTPVLPLVTRALLGLLYGE
jgi:hypothetical protein